MNGMTLKLRNQKINPNLNMLKTNKHVNEANQKFMKHKTHEKKPKIETYYMNQRIKQKN